MSIYVPIDIFNVGSECIYKFSAEISQFGTRIRFKEIINEFFDIAGNRIEGTPARVIEGNGQILEEKNIIVQFREKGSLTCGTMYLTTNNRGTEIQGIVAVQNPYFGTPVCVKIILRRSNEQHVTFEEIGAKRIQTMITALFDRNT